MMCVRRMICVLVVMLTLTSNAMIAQAQLGRTATNFFILDSNSVEFFLGEKNHTEQFSVFMTNTGAKLRVPSYYEFRFLVVPNRSAAFKSSGTMTIRMTTNASKSFSCEIPIEAGASSVSSEFVASIAESYQTEAKLEVWFNGRELRGLRSFVYDNGPAAVGSTDRRLTVVDKSTFEPTTAPDGYASRFVYGYPGTTDRDHLFCATDRITGSWLPFTAFDDVVVKAPALHEIDAAGLDTLTTYVLAGGELIIEQASSKSEIQKYFALDFGQSYRLPKLTKGSNDQDQDESSSPKAELDASDEITGLQVLHLGLGRVVVDPHVSEGSVHSPTTLSNRGIRFENGIGDDFWQWMIPSVGRTPVVIFLGFVFLFAGVAAPALMIWSNRVSRRIWLVLFVPTFGLACTLALFVFAITKDGFETKIRVRSFTFHDGRGHSVVWSRQSYFAATPPQTVSFGPDTQVATASHSPMQASGKLEQIVAPGQQRFRGLIAPRTMTNLFVCHPVKRNSPFEILPSQSPMEETQDFWNIKIDRNVPAIVNRLGAAWYKAVFVAHNGTPYLSQSPTELDQEVILQRSTIDECRRALQTAYDSQPLLAPADAPTVRQRSLSDSLSSTFGFRSYRRRNWGGSEGLIFEEAMWQRYAGEKAMLRPGTYVIYAADAPDLERCLTGNESDCLHVIAGNW